MAQNERASNDIGAMIVTNHKVVIVYQFGKVGSTSLVAALNEVEGVTAYQCHFLGEESYTSIVKLVLSGQHDDYFSKHALGQLSQNVEAERAMLECERRGGDSYFFSMSREPIEWYRSAVSQDLQGTIANFSSFAEHMGETQRPISYVIDVLRSEIKQVLRDGKRDAVLSIRGGELVAKHIDRWTSSYGIFASTVAQQLNIFFRPFSWFDVHFLSYTGKNVELDSNGVYCANDGRRNYLVMRYEDYANVRDTVVRLWGIQLGDIKKENVSETKAGADRVKAAFAKWKSDEELVALLDETDYCKRFGYSSGCTCK